MLDGVNDRYEQALALAALLAPQARRERRRSIFKVNLIPYNPTGRGLRRLHARRRSPPSAATSCRRATAVDAAVATSTPRAAAAAQVAAPPASRRTWHAPPERPSPRLQRRRRRARPLAGRSSRSRSSACSSGVGSQRATSGSSSSERRPNSLRNCGRRAVEDGAELRVAGLLDQPRSSSVATAESALTPRMRVISGPRDRLQVGDDRERLGLRRRQRATTRGRLNSRRAASSESGSVANVQPPPSSRSTMPSARGVAFAGQQRERGRAPRLARPASPRPARPRSADRRAGTAAPRSSARARASTRRRAAHAARPRQPAGGAGQRRPAPRARAASGACTAISPKLSPCSQSASPRLYSSSSANSVTATVMRSAPRTASSKLNAPRRSRPRSRCRGARRPTTRGTATWRRSICGRHQQQRADRLAEQPAGPVTPSAGATIVRRRLARQRRLAEAHAVLASRAARRRCAAAER